ncbi:TIGR00269 family protein [Candidatus Woesearchaeota archaeon]|nr:TIGR00269 family protein [Candidatus Woesearchaeota archaeon]
MKCEKCTEKAVLSGPALCKKHFIDYFEKKVIDTIRKQRLFNKTEKVCVASSGGKDSTAVLYLAARFLGPKNRPTALLIDEGISGYRDQTISDLKRFCKENYIALKIVSFEKEFGMTLDRIIRSKKINLKPCNICGTLRRYLLNRHSRGFDVIVTGHNLDDESQAVMMNLLRQQVDVLARLGPSTGIAKQKGFTQRVKPLYFCSEKETALYALLKGFDVSFNECPYIVESYRADIRDMLNAYEAAHRGTKQSIVSSFMRMLPKLKKESAHTGPQACTKCGEPCAASLCNACRLVTVLRRSIK